MYRLQHSPPLINLPAPIVVPVVASALTVVAIFVAAVVVAGRGRVAVESWPRYYGSGSSCHRIMKLEGIIIVDFIVAIVAFVLVPSTARPHSNVAAVLSSPCDETSLSRCPHFLTLFMRLTVCTSVASLVTHTNILTHFNTIRLLNRGGMTKGHTAPFLILSVRLLSLIFQLMGTVTHV